MPSRCQCKGEESDEKQHCHCVAGLENSLTYGVHVNVISAHRKEKLLKCDAGIIGIWDLTELVTRQSLLPDTLLRVNSVRVGYWDKCNRDSIGYWGYVPGKVKHGNTLYEIPD